MRRKRLARVFGGRQAARGLTFGDIDAAIWPRLKAAKAKGVVPNLWEFRISAHDAQALGLGKACDLCLESLTDALEREGLDAREATVICGRGRGLEAGTVKVEAKRADEHAMAMRLAAARAAQDEVRGRGTSTRLVCSWNATPMEVNGGVTIGRNPLCDIVVDWPGISRRHGQISTDGADGLLYIDRSKNGSTVDGELVHGACVTIHEGSKIGLAPGLFIDVVGMAEAS